MMDLILMTCRIAIGNFSDATGTMFVNFSICTCILIVLNPILCWKTDVLCSDKIIDIPDLSCNLALIYQCLRLLGYVLSI